MVQIRSILIMALSMSLGRVASAAPTNGTSPTTTSVAPAAVSSIVAANPIKFPPVNPHKIPVPGAADNSTLLQVAPQVAVNNTHAPAKRDVAQTKEKRFDCIDQFTPWAPDWLWDGYSLAFCDYYFPTSSGTFWIQAGYCFSGTVPASGPYPNLNFNYCAKNPGVLYPVFVAVTNQICLDEFEGIVSYEDNTWTCPGFDLGAHPGQIYGGDNFNDNSDSSNWQIYAS